MTGKRRLDYDGEEAKWLFPSSPPVLADDYEFDDCDSGNQGLERVESSDEESSNADSSLVPNIGQEDVGVDAAYDDSSDDDIVDETVKEMHEILVKVSPFNPLRADNASQKRSLRPAVEKGAR